MASAGTKALQRWTHAGRRSLDLMFFRVAVRRCTGAGLGSPGAETFTAARGETLTSASQVLCFYASRRHDLTLADATALFRRVEYLEASAHDERLQRLVGDIVGQRSDLPLGALVDVARIVQGLGLHDEFASLIELAMDSTSFLPSDIVLSFACTLAKAGRKLGSLHGGGAGQLESHAAVFRILGEHVQEAMFDAAPMELAEALLALAVFHCSKGGAGLEPLLAKPRHLAVFASAAALLLGGRAAAAPPRAMVKCLRAYSILLLQASRSSAAVASGGVSAATRLLGPGDDVGGGGVMQQALQQPSAAGLGGVSAELVPPALAEVLAPRLSELSMHDVVHGLHAITSLHSKHVLMLDPRSKAFCHRAAAELEARPDELGIREISFALRALATFDDACRKANAAAEQGEFCSDRSSVPRELLQTLYGEVQHHVHSLILDDALQIAGAAGKLTHVSRAGVLVDLLAAEVLRELRRLQPQQICDAVVSFNRLGYRDTSFLQSLSRAFIAKMMDFLPRQLAVTMHSFASSGFCDRAMTTAAAPQILRDFVGFEPRDVSFSLWSFAKSSHLYAPVFRKVQEDLEQQGTAGLGPRDLSMLLWSFAEVGWVFEGDALSKLTHSIARHCTEFPPDALIVSCVGFAKLGFAQQSVLVEVYRSLYPKLPQLSDSQLAFAFFLFSTSGIRDEALLRRFLFECSRRLPRLRGQALSNVLLACSRTTTSEALLRTHSLGDGLRKHVFQELDRMGSAALISAYMAAPKVFALRREESIEIMDSIADHLPQLDAAGLARCLVATAEVNVLHKPFLLPLFHYLRRARAQLTAGEVMSCIWSVYSLGFCKPKFQRTLGFTLQQHVQERRLPARTLCDALPAINYLGLWERLPNSLRRSVWRLASDGARQGMRPPPPPPQLASEDGSARPPRPWRLPTVQKGYFRKKGSVLSRLHHLESIASAERDEEGEKQEEREIIEVQRQSDGKTAVSDFISLVRRL